MKKATTLKRIYLYGSMAEKFSKEPIELAVDDVAGIHLAFKSIFPGWREHVRTNPEMAFIITDDDKENMQPILPDFISMKFPDAKEIHIMHEANGEWAAAIAYIGTLSFSAIVVNVLISMAVSTVLGMISQALAPSPDTGSKNKNVAKNESFLYNGPQNTDSQGGPVPLIYGYFMAGSTVVSASIDVEQLLVRPEKTDPPANGGGQPQPSTPPAVEWQWAGK